MRLYLLIRPPQRSIGKGDEGGGPAEAEAHEGKVMLGAEVDQRGAVMTMCVGVPSGWKLNSMPLS
jgi:hypothetical protein